MPPTSIRVVARHLHQAPKRIEELKESTAWDGAGIVLALVQAHFPEVVGIEQLEEGAPVRDDGEDVDVTALLPTCQVAASRIATFLHLKVFVKEKQAEEQ